MSEYEYKLGTSSRGALLFTVIVDMYCMPYLYLVPGGTWYVYYYTDFITLNCFVRGILKNSRSMIHCVKFK